ncbi:MAG: plasmid partitioning protein RepB C-terminal domain-containing protein [Alphaproteobacteria bacterium]|nr:plasmid partitioning protein RepB C-terminal domain-containing protein [Alphaproteobacteria bacterium]
MANKIKKAFESEIITVAVDDLILTKNLPKNIYKTKKFSSIVASIREIGIIEPPVVVFKDDKYTLLDGHLRIAALKKLEQENVVCLISTDDEAFTYNKHVNRLSNVQEHKMIVKAIERGVPAARLAKVLNVNVASILGKKNLLVGICQEASDLLKDKIVSSRVFGYLKKMKEFRQIEAANLMNDSKNYTTKFARAIWLASSDNQLITPHKKKIDADSGSLSRLENEVVKLQGEFSIIEDNIS